MATDFDQAVARYREFIETTNKGEIPRAGEAIQTLADTVTLARAYIAERDETPVTEEWLRSVGFGSGNFDSVELDRIIVFRGCPWIRCASDRNDAAKVSHSGCTRGQVRTLARLLSITLKEPANG